MVDQLSYHGMLRKNCGKNNEMMQFWESEDHMALCCHMGISHYSIFQVPCHNLGAVNKVALIILLRIEFALMFIIIHSLIFLHFWLAQIPWLILDNQIWKMSVISWTMTSNSTGYQKKGSQPRSPGDKVA